MASGTIGVGVAQFAPSTDTRANLEVVSRLTHVAVERGARIVVFPEYSSYFVDPFDASLAENAQELDGEFTTALTALAAEHDVVIVAGLVERGSGELVRNAAVAVDASGIRAVYRKLHLYDAFGQRESDWVEPGALEHPQTFEVNGIRFGLMTCYDLRFPEVARLLADADVNAILVPAEWVRGPLKEYHWRTLLHARAIENTVFVAAADHPPPLGVGHSMIVSPAGVELAGLGATAEGVAVAYLDASEIARVRRVNPALALRRFRVAPR